MILVEENDSTCAGGIPTVAYLHTYGRLLRMSGYNYLEIDWCWDGASTGVLFTCCLRHVR